MPVAILTGATQGIGRATAIAFARAGYRLAVVARSEASLHALAAYLPNTLPIPADITDPHACVRIVEQTITHFGSLDILINNAGLGIYGPGAETPPTDLNRVLAVNFGGAVSLMQACIPVMKNAGGGLIINVSSIIGRRSTPLAAGYCASKAALEHYVESLRMELAPYNIRFSTLYPGVTRTNFVDNALGKPQHRRGRVKGVPPEKVAARLLVVAQKKPRDAYVTASDWLFVTGSYLFPRLADWILGKYFSDSISTVEHRSAQQKP